MVDFVLAKKTKLNIYQSNQVHNVFSIRSKPAENILDRNL